MSCMTVLGALTSTGRFQAVSLCSLQGQSEMCKGSCKMHTKKLERNSCTCAGPCTDNYRLVVVVWCGVVWCGVVWCGVVWCGVVCRSGNMRIDVAHGGQGTVLVIQALHQCTRRGRSQRHTNWCTGRKPCFVYFPQLSL